MKKILLLAVIAISLASCSKKEPEKPTEIRTSDGTLIQPGMILKVDKVDNDGILVSPASYDDARAFLEDNGEA